MILPARWLVGDQSSAWTEPLRIPLGLIGLLLGLAFSFWAIRTQWVVGEGTPSLNAPPQPLVTLGQESRLNSWVAEQIELSPGARVLDVGCGTGLLTARIATRHPQLEVVGIDASRPMIEQARRKRQSANCHFRQALGEDLPFAEESFAWVAS